MAMSKVFLAICAALFLTACSTVEKLTGQTDDTVLPGQREDAIPGRPQYPDPQAGTGTVAQTAGAEAKSDSEPAAEATAEPAPCPAEQPDCVPPAIDDTFSDGQ